MSSRKKAPAQSSAKAPAKSSGKAPAKKSSSSSSSSASKAPPPAAFEIEFNKGDCQPMPDRLRQRLTQSPAPPKQRDIDAKIKDAEKRKQEHETARLQRIHKMDERMKGKVMAASKALEKEQHRDKK